ncbi:hypothetical protein H2198_005063 [Neophaeococcomyces mojaviensis]|uniref:Uncharacterized protein n=1 Tax=Neophaeococcomyces mojaviensis TaxID=3383035 RepID=A0ACC3A730_9EURO|nr:hypothetical protein H2198_005063 [Knufia sp. JES_112]
MVTVSHEEAGDFKPLTYCWGSSTFDGQIICDSLKLAVTESLERTLKAYRRSMDIFGKRPLWVDAPKKVYKEILSTLPGSDTPAWTYYMDIFSVPWSRRTWVLQEIALARNARIRYGRYVFPWDSFLDAFTFFTNPTGMCLLSMISILDICRTTQETEEQPSSLLSLLREPRNQAATDPRDKVIGILGIIRNGLTHDHTSYIAKYGLPVGEVYHRLAVHLVRRGRACGPLSLTIFRPSSYSAATAAEPHIRLERKAGTGQPQDDSVPPRILSVAGWCIDTIKHLSDAHSLHADPERTGHTEIQRRFLTWHASAKSQTPIHGHSDIENINDAAAVNAFARTLLVNDLYTGDNQTSMSAPITNPAASLARVIANLERSNVSASSTGTGTDREGLKHTNYDGTEDSTYAQQVFAAAPGRRFAVTAGGILGLVAAASRVGDGIAVFAGGACLLSCRMSKFMREEA